MSDLEGKVALVTGVSGGVGQAIVRSLKSAGATVAGVDMVAPAPEQSSHGRPDSFTRLDVTSETSVQAVVQEILEAFGRIDILVNNAGLVKIAPIESMSELDWDEMFDVNVKGAFFCCREVVRHMHARGGPGRIINISSTAARIGVKNHVHYCAAKAAVLGLTKGLALDLAPHGVTVNAICPGPTDTGMLDDVVKKQSARHNLSRDAYEARVVSAIPLGRKVKPEHVADTVAFLASPAGDSITGQTLSVDGGIVRL